MSWRPNATAFTISRYPRANGDVDFEVTWENSWGELADPDDPDDEPTPDEGSALFPTLAEAFTFCEGLLAAVKSLNEETE